MNKLSEDQLSLLKTFFALLAKQPNRVYRQKIPEEMLVPSKNSLPSFEWKLIENTKLSESDFSSFEKQIGHNLPTLYKNWLLFAHFFPIRMGSIEVYGNHPTTPLAEIKSIYNETLISQKLFPIGKDGWSAQLFVLDYNESPNHPPLKLFTPASKFQQAKLKDQIVFSSFEHLLNAWIYEFGEAKEKRVSRKDVYTKFAEFDPPSTLHWEETIAVMEAWDDMKP
ncbi:MAG: hypothetical protein ACWA41_04865 [Putridiphycobacter sp.]